jgi:hypothetical protein
MFQSQVRLAPPLAILFHWHGRITLRRSHAVRELYFQAMREAWRASLSGGKVHRFDQAERSRADRGHGGDEVHEIGPSARHVTMLRPRPAPEPAHTNQL